MKRPVAITIAGQRYHLKSDADEAYVARLATYLDDKVRQVQEAGRPGPQQAVVLAALQVADELFRERERRADLRRRIRARCEDLLERLVPAEKK